MDIQVKKRKLKVLSFDIENRPLSYWYDGNCTAEVTAIAAGWHHSNKVYCWALGEDDPLTMMEEFLDLYDDADIVTGHYIRKHDLPILNGAAMEMGLIPLKPKLTVDTRLDLTRVGGLAASQEALSAMLELDNPKHHMTQSAWRQANRLEPEGVSLTKKRVISDVLQHKELYGALAPYLKRPKVWRP